jgi:hypothetical protein
MASARSTGEQQNHSSRGLELVPQIGVLDLLLGSEKHDLGLSRAPALDPEKPEGSENRHRGPYALVGGTLVESEEDLTLFPSTLAEQGLGQGELSRNPPPASAAARARRSPRTGSKVPRARWAPTTSNWGAPPCPASRRAVTRRRRSSRRRAPTASRPFASCRWIVDGGQVARDSRTAGRRLG